MSHVPMSNPEMMIACIEPFPFSRGACIQLKSGRVVACSGCGFGYSDDAGLTWCEPYEGAYGNGEKPKLMNLVELESGGIGATQTHVYPGAPSNLHRQIYFTVTQDLGRTWSDPRAMSLVRLPMHTFQNAMIRTSRGRIIQPVYSAVGQGSYHSEEARFPGGYVDGEWVGTDAHYYDTHFGCAMVLYSDDDGRTWQVNRNGELLIYTDDGLIYPVAEPSVVEVEPRNLLMFLRTSLGRAYQSWSYDDGETWTRPLPTHLASSNAPVILDRLSASGHLLVIWNQASEDEIKQGYVRSRLSAAVSRNGGGVWEFFQNVESAHEQRHVYPGPIRQTRPEGEYAVHAGLAAFENDTRYELEMIPHDRWTNPIMCALEDRVLIAYSGCLKILPLTWFYRGRDPHAQSGIFTKYQMQMPPRYLPEPPPASAVPEAERRLSGFFKGDPPQSGSD